MGNSRFSDGFLLGALVGGAAVFLLGTKKGNKVLEAITEEGLEGLTDLIDVIEEKQIVPKTQKAVSEVKDAVEERIELEAPKVEKSAKRFFKKSK